MKVWILDENSNHVATITGEETEVIGYATEVYPHGPLDDFRIDRAGYQCANAAFDFNPNATIIDL